PWSAAASRLRIRICQTVSDSVSRSGILSGVQQISSLADRASFRTKKSPRGTRGLSERTAQPETENKTGEQHNLFQLSASNLILI
ncbi:MAG: hypothetical protein WCE98_02880, partial [Chlorobium sp.]